MAELPATSAVDLELTGEWLTVWFNEPERRNPLSEARSQDLMAVCEAIADQRDIRGVTFRGRGGVFCAGGDLKAFRSVFQGGGDAEATRAMSRSGGKLFDVIDHLPQVTVMAVEGAAVAGGLGLVCAGDVVIVEDSAKFSLTETMIGLSPAQIAPFVVRRLGLPLARRLMLTGVSFDGNRAAEFGLADEAVSGSVGIDAAIDGVRAQVMRCAPGAVADTKRLISELNGRSREDEIELAAEVFAERIHSDEGREGVASFVEKRKPAWVPKS
ncbi:MAG: enoyl-CoA hydratase/isomerase family protein [Rhizobiaceae bacterium]